MNKTSDQQEFNFLTSIIFIISAIGSIIKSLTTLLSNIKHIPDSIVIWVPFIGTLINAYAVLYLILSKRRILGAYIFVGMGLLSIILSFIVPDVDPVSMIIANSIQIVSFSLILLLPKNKKTGWRLLIENSGIRIFDNMKSNLKSKKIKKNEDQSNKIEAETVAQQVEPISKFTGNPTDNDFNKKLVTEPYKKPESTNDLRQSEYDVFNLKNSPKKNIVSANAVLYCITAIICSIILGSYYFKANRYIPMHPNYDILDKKKGTVIEYNKYDAVEIEFEKMLRENKD